MFCNVILIILFLIESVIDVLYTDKCIDFITFPFLKQVAICVIFFLKVLGLLYGITFVVYFTVFFICISVQLLY